MSACRDTTAGTVDGRDRAAWFRFSSATTRSSTGLVNNGARVGGRAHVLGHVTCGAHIAGSDIVAAGAVVGGSM